MNKYQEALDKIDNTQYIWNYHQEEVKILQELVDKATPKKPIFDFETLVHECPYCLSYASGVYHKVHCGYCGQRLDWSTDNE